MRISEIFPGCTSRSRRNADGGLQTKDAERAFFEFLHFFAAGVRSMIGGDGVYGAGDDALRDGADIAGRAQRRLHFVVAVVGRHFAVGEREMVRRGFACHRQARALAKATISTEWRDDMWAT